MRALILSCNTGEGHNSAGRAMKERIRAEGHQAEMIDIMLLAGERTSKRVGNTYINVAKNFPRLFGALYKLGGLISSSKRKSPVYYANSLLAKKLRQYLDENDTDVIITPHLFPAETLTYMKRKNMLTEKTIAIATDYTCIPFWEETDCDAYIVPHEDLLEENRSRGLRKNRMYPYGIPVGMDFLEKRDQAEARKMLHLQPDKPVYLIMSGSMGFGKIHLFAFELERACKNEEQIVIICGNNKKVRHTLKTVFGRRKNMHIIGYTDKVSLYMDACDVVYTKPGGLTSTEALVKNIPMVHTAPIPGCEIRNMEFFTSHGISVAAGNIRTQVALGKMLVENKEVREGMLAAQRKCRKPQAAQDIFQLAMKIIRPLEENSGIME